MMAIKIWQHHDDLVLSTLCKCILDRRLLKIRLQTNPFDKEQIATKKESIRQQLHVTEEEAGYLVFTGVAENTIYNPKDERINILFKDGTVKDISEVDNPIIQQSMIATVGKHYICWLQTE